MRYIQLKEEIQRPATEEETQGYYSGQKYSPSASIWPRNLPLINGKKDANTLLAYYHYFSKDLHPWLEGCNMLQLYADAELDDGQLQFIKKSKIIVAQCSE